MTETVTPQIGDSTQPNTWPVLDGRLIDKTSLSALNHIPAVIENPKPSLMLATSQTSARETGFDVLRGIAVLLVLGRHLWEIPKSLPLIERIPLILWQRGGWVGVDLFFVLSGFLISRLLFEESLKTGCFSTRRFYLRRAFKIYPAFALLFMVTLGVWGLVKGRLQPLPNILAEVFFVQSYFPGLWNHTWSLAVEEHFYLLLPGLLWLLAASRRGQTAPFAGIVGLTLVWAGVSWGLRWEHATRHPLDWEWRLFSTHLRLDSLLIGVTLGYFRVWHSARMLSFCRSHATALLCLGTIGLLPVFVSPLEATPWLSVSGLTLFALASAALVGSVLGMKSQSSVWTAPLDTIGRSSYAIYLCHMPVVAWLLPGLEQAIGHRFPFNLRLGLYLGVSCVIGWLVTALLEAPLLRLRDRWIPRERKPAASNLAVGTISVLPAGSVQ